jgi:bifunctional non-homologous end joining protein LigD
MLAVAARELPTPESEWAAEPKLDGMRASALIDSGTLRLRSRTGRDITSCFPELQALVAAAGRRALILDGEIIVQDPRGRPSFSLLQRRMHVTRPGPRLVESVPVVFMAFDVLQVAGKSLLASAYERRRAVLEGLPLQSVSAGIVPAFPGDASALAQATASLRMEGVVLKRMDARYFPGRRAPAWLKLKHLCRDRSVRPTAPPGLAWPPPVMTVLPDRLRLFLVGHFSRNLATALSLSGYVRGYCWVSANLADSQ